MKKDFNLKLVAAVVVFLMISIGLFGQLSRNPDLTIEKITVDRKCHLVVVVKNNGPGYLPNSVYTSHHSKSAGVFVYINRKGWGGQSIWKFDPAKKLQKPGGMATYISKYIVGKPVYVKAVVDLHNDVTEDNETNTSIVEVLIKDNEIGFSSELKDQIFNYGFTTRKTGGMGFGLHFCANYIQSIGGSIKAESEGLGKGATFIVKIPLKNQGQKR